MSLTAKDIAEITRLLEDSSFDELELEIDGLKIHLRRSGAPPPAIRGAACGDIQPSRPRESVSGTGVRARGRSVTWSWCARHC